MPEGEEVSFQYAVEKLLDQNYKGIDKRNIVQTKFEYQNFEVSNTSKARSYLTEKRKIDEELVNKLFELDLIAQDKRENVVFKWIDYNNNWKITGASVQGTKERKNGERSYKRIQKNSKSGNGFNLMFGEPRNIKFFESAIDLLSYASLNPEKLEDNWLVSMEGLKRGVVMNSFKSCLDFRNMNEDYAVNSVTFCVDNDEAGVTFAEEFIKTLKLKNTLTNKDESFILDIPRHTKDWNDELIFLKESTNKNNIRIIDDELER